MVIRKVTLFSILIGLNHFALANENTYERSKEVAREISQAVESREDLIHSLNNLPADTSPQQVADIAFRQLGIVHQKHELAAIAFDHFLKTSTTPEADYWVKVNDLIGDYGEVEHIPAFLLLVSVSAVMERESFEQTVEDLIEYTQRKNLDPSDLFTEHARRIPEPRRAFVLSRLDEARQL